MILEGHNKTNNPGLEKKQAREREHVRKRRREMRKRLLTSRVVTLRKFSHQLIDVLSHRLYRITMVGVV